MSKQTVLARPIDPEFAEVYEQANSSSSTGPLPRQPESRSNPPNTSSQKERISTQDEAFEGVDALKRLALQNQSTAIDRKTLKPGSFDQIENDVSNAVKLGWDWLTRP